MESKIVGGKFEKIKNYPHTAFLSVICEDSWVCGASILNQRMFLTACHCVYGCSVRNGDHCMNFYAGGEDLRKVRLNLASSNHR